MSGGADAQTQRTMPAADGSLSLPAATLPFSEYASPEAREEQAGRLSRLAQLQNHPAQLPVPGQPDLLHRPWFDAQWRRYPAMMSEETLGGVKVLVFTPKNGIADKNRHRVLINLHGGGFVNGWPEKSEIESLPIASVGRIKVVSVDYRMGPQSRFPAASQDVAAVYAALLNTYKPSQIGIYGCSAGGILTGEAVAWFDKAGLPQPGAIGIFSGSLVSGFGGDSAYLTPLMGGYFPAPHPGAATANPYFADANPNDPLAAPANSPALLAKFPPTLFATGTRAGDMSATIESHRRLIRAGIDARLHLWDGLEHCFMYNPDLPESQEAYGVLTRFLEEQLDRLEAPTGGRASRW
jgi:acetyl esterase/lipase